MLCAHSQQSVSALARLDGDMGVPTAPEASGPRRGTLLLALFLAASRGKVRRRWGAGEERRGAQPGRVEEPRQHGSALNIPSACGDLHPTAALRLLGQPIRVQRGSIPAEHICTLARTHEQLPKQQAKVSLGDCLWHFPAQRAQSRQGPRRASARQERNMKRVTPAL